MTKLMKTIMEEEGLHAVQRQFKNYSHEMEVQRAPKKKQEAKATTRERHSALNVRLFLKKLFFNLLENCYNHLIYIVKNSYKPRKDTISWQYIICRHHWRRLPGPIHYQNQWRSRWEWTLDHPHNRRIFEICLQG
ncbi:protein timeless homolog [Ambystoma mexicanum]|uniref:protein timeless homolog n=1 Tax=Ambystoma mexicanum TaxID=8296 RepID=UPI0037E8E9CD